MFRFAKFFFDKLFIRSFILRSSQIIRIFMNLNKFSNNELCWFWYRTIFRWIIKLSIKWIISLSTSSKTFLLTLRLCFFLFFRILVNAFYSSFRCLFSFFVIIFSIISNLETFLLSAFVERTTQKIFRVENVIEKNISFATIVFNFLQIISSNKIAISNRNAEKKIQNEQMFSAKKSSNDVERQHFDAASSSLSFNVSKSNDQKNFDSFVDFSVLFIEQRATTLIRVWCEFCIRCVKLTAFCVRVVNSIICQ